MKANIKLPAGIAIAMIAVLVAFQSVNPGEERGDYKVKVVRESGPSLYGEEDVGFLMQSNHWTREQARGVLDFASEAAYQNASARKAELKLMTKK